MVMLYIVWWVPVLCVGRDALHKVMRPMATGASVNAGMPSFGGV